MLVIGGPLLLLVVTDLDSFPAIALGWIPTAFLASLFGEMPSDRDLRTRQLRRRSSGAWSSAWRRGFLAVAVLVAVAIVADWSAIRLGL